MCVFCFSILSVCVCGLHWSRWCEMCMLCITEFMHGVIPGEAEANRRIVKTFFKTSLYFHRDV